MSSSATDSKYQPLADYLSRASGAGRATVDLDAAQIADLVDGGLPPTAYRLRQWRAIDSKVEARAWRSAGGHVESVSLDNQRVRFALGSLAGRAQRAWLLSDAPAGRRSLHSALKGCSSRPAEVPGALVGRCP